MDDAGGPAVQHSRGCPRRVPASISHHRSVVSRDAAGGRPPPLRDAPPPPGLVRAVFVLECEAPVVNGNNTPWYRGRFEFGSWRKFEDSLSSRA